MRPVASRPLEPAQVVWARAIELADPQRFQLFGVTLEVLRSARHDSATMAHALTLGRSRVREHPTDTAAKRAITLLEQAIEFLGVRPRADEVGAASFRS